MPSGILYFLSSVAVVFAIFSLTCYFKSPANWPTFLRVIAVANLSYCFVTVILMIIYRNEITGLGLVYFAGEIVVVSTLAAYELITARRAAGR